MKQNKKHVLFHMPTGMFFRSCIRNGIDSNNRYIIEMYLTCDLDQADLGSKNKMTQIIKRLSPYHCRDKQKQEIALTDFQIREVKVSFDMLP
jgi:hypothetical protein